MKYTVFHKQAVIGADEFVSRYRDVERVATYCQQCPVYGKSWGCPPFDFDPCIVSNGFKTVWLLGTIIAFDEETRTGCTTPDQSAATARKAMHEVLNTLLPKLYELERREPGSLIFTFRCELCPEGCTRPQGKPCRHPELLRYSLESVGFDLVAMTRDLLGIDLEWSIDGMLPRHITLITALMLPEKIKGLNFIKPLFNSQSESQSNFLRLKTKL